MNNKKRNFIFFTLVVIQLIIAVVFLTNSFYYEDIRQVRSFGPTDTLVEGVVLSQEFKSKENDLSEIELFIDTKDRVNNSDVTIEIIEIIDKADGEIIRTVTRNSKSFKNNAYEKFSFLKIEDSEGKNYILRVTSNNGTIENSIALFASIDDQYEDGDLLIGDRREQKDLRFKTYYSTGVLNKVNHVLDNGYMNKYLVIFIASVFLVYLNLVIYLLLSNILKVNSNFNNYLNVKENDNKIVKHFKNNIYTYVGLTIILMYVLPYFLLGENSFILIHDNLDSNVTWYKILAESGKYFSEIDSTIPNLIDGLPRNVLGSELFVVRLLYLVLNPFQAYVANQIIIRVVAYFGMIFLLKNYVSKEDKLITYGVAVCFALLPFWPSAGLSIAGQPLALWAFLKIRQNNDTLVHWILLPIIAMYSSLVLASSFFLFALGILWLIDLIKFRKFNIKFFLALAFMGVCYLAIEYRLVYSMFLGSDYVSHRTEWLLSILPARTALRNSIENFTTGQYQAASLHLIFINVTVILSIITMFITKKFHKKTFIAIGILIVISLLYGFWEYKGLAGIKDSISIFATFRFSRFNWLQALIWHLLFAQSLVIISRFLTEKLKKSSKSNFIKLLILLALVGQIAFAFYKSDFNTEFMNDYPTFKEFYSEDLMMDIKDYIGKDQSEYRIISVGLEPAITQYNGFYTLDGYLPNYPLEYKHKFREIIKDELSKNEDAKGYYDRWGSKFFVFPSAIFPQFRSDNNNYIISKSSNLKLDNLNLNTEALKEMKCDYVFAALPITNNEENGLELLEMFEREDSIWKIYLYKVK